LIDVNCLRIYRVQVMEDDVAGPCPWHDMVVAQSTELEAKRHMIGNSQPCVTSGNEGSHCGFEQEDLVRKCLSSCSCHLPILCSLVVVSWSWPKLAGARRLPDAETRLLGPHSYDTSNARSYAHHDGTRRRGQSPGDSRVLGQPICAVERRGSHT
jgi:hypothetical protein